MMVHADLLGGGLDGLLDQFYKIRRPQFAEVLQIFGTQIDGGIVIVFEDPRWDWHQLSNTFRADVCRMQELLTYSGTAVDGISARPLAFPGFLLGNTSLSLLFPSPD